MAIVWRIRYNIGSCQTSSISFGAHKDTQTPNTYRYVLIPICKHIKVEDSLLR